MAEADVQTSPQHVRELHLGVIPRIIAHNGLEFIAKALNEGMRISGTTRRSFLHFFTQVRQGPPSPLVSPGYRTLL